MCTDARHSTSQWITQPEQAVVPAVPVVAVDVEEQAADAVVLAVLELPAALLFLRFPQFRMLRQGVLRAVRRRVAVEVVPAVVVLVAVAPAALREVAVAALLAVVVLVAADAVPAVVLRRLQPFPAWRSSTC